MSPNHSPPHSGFDTPAGIYVATLAAFLVASFFPEGRIWGLNWWAYWPDWVASALFLVGLGLIFPCRIIGSSRDNYVAVSLQSGDGLLSRLSFPAIGLVGLGLFYFLRAETHFLGDGYGLLKLLASNKVNYLQISELGESLAHLWVSSMVGGIGESSALASFQIISIAAGVMFLTVLLFFSRRLFEATVDRLLFTAGVATGGYMLLYFGYVENYSLLVLAIMTFTLAGLLVSLERLKLWLALPAVMVAIFFHVAGVVLIPGAAYLLLSDGSIQKGVKRVSSRLWVVLSLTTILLLLWLFYHFYTTNYFFRFAIIPLFENRVTADGYTLLSLNHLGDFANLLWLLLPGLPVLLASLMYGPMKKLLRERSFRFLFISLVSTLVACFAIDPRLGMPRDWDLLSIAGVPLAILLYYFVLSRGKNMPRYRTYAALSVALGLLVLLPRAFSQTSTIVAMAHFDNYSRLDKPRYLFTDLLLKTYYTRTQDTESANSVDSIWKQRYPEKVLFERASLAKKTGRYNDAIGMFREVLKLHPSYANAFNNLGNCFRATGQLDSALEYHLIATGLRPYNAASLYNLGLTYAYLGKIHQAEKALLNSYRRDNTNLLTVLALVSAYKQLENAEEYERFLKVAATHKEAPPLILKEMGDWHASIGGHESAVTFYRKAIQRGLDSILSEQLLKQYPALRQ